MPGGVRCGAKSESRLHRGIVFPSRAVCCCLTRSAGAMRVPMVGAQLQVQQAVLNRTFLLATDTHEESRWDARPRLGLRLRRDGSIMVSQNSLCSSVLLGLQPAVGRSRIMRTCCSRASGDAEEHNEASTSTSKPEQDLLITSPAWLPALPHVLTAAMANFMFGYHIGILNGPLDSIAKELQFGEDKILQGLVVSVLVVGAFAGSIVGGILTDRIGRRRTFQLDAIPLILGASISAGAQSINGMLLGRFLVGLGIGVNTGLVPLYISEVAPTKYRGALGSLCQVGTCVGIISALLIGIPAETDPHWWRTMFWIGTVPSFLLIAGMQYAAESPRWLVKVGRLDDARRVVERLWGTSQVEAAMVDLTDGQEGAQEEASWSELLSGRYLKLVAIGGSLFALQQFAGINGILYFSSLTFRNAGIPNGMVASAAVGVANLAGAMIALSLMDRQGRRNLLRSSYLGMAVSIGVLVLAMEAPVGDQYGHDLSILGTLTYVFTFALGAGPVTALIIPELCDTKSRAKVLAVSLCVHWMCNFGIGLFFLELVAKFGLDWVYASFGAVSLLSIVFTNAFIVETKGKSLEEIEALVFPAKDA